MRALVVLAFSVFMGALACGGSASGPEAPPAPQQSAAFIRAEQACGALASEPAVEWLPTVPCTVRGYICCIGPDRGSEYDVATNTIRLADGSRCRAEMLRVNLVCEYENAVSWQAGETIDRCIQPC